MHSLSLLILLCSLLLPLCSLLPSVSAASDAAYNHSASPAPIQLNSATPGELANALPGIGPVKAQAIVNYRQQHGPFGSVDDLVEVKGIGPATIKKIKPLLVVDMRATPTGTSVNAHSRVRSAESGTNAEEATRQAVRSIVNIARRAERQQKELLSITE